MKRIDPGVPKALRDVWAWKDAVYRQVKDLPVDEALSAILDRAEQTAASAKRPKQRLRRRPKSTLARPTM
jgi:hypothetical protein